MPRSSGFPRGILILTMFLTLSTSTHAAAGAATAECATPEPITAAAEPGSDASEAFAAGIETLVETVAACQSDGQAKRLVALVSPGYLGDAFAGGGRLAPDAFLALAPDLPRAHLGIRSVENVRVAPSGNVTADVVAVRARQLTHARWRFVEDRAEEGRWLADGLTPLAVEPPRDADTAAITLKDGRYTPGRLRVDGPSVVVTADNAGKADHELLVIQITGEGVEASDLLSTTDLGLPDGVRFVAQQTVLAGETATLVLVSLRPGDYLIVDLFPTADGIPNLALGMQAELIVS